MPQMRGTTTSASASGRPTSARSKPRYSGLVTCAWATRPFFQGEVHRQIAFHAIERAQNFAAHRRFPVGGVGAMSSRSDWALRRNPRRGDRFGQGRQGDKPGFGHVRRQNGRQAGQPGRGQRLAVGGGKVWRSAVDAGKPTLQAKSWRHARADIAVGVRQRAATARCSIKQPCWPNAWAVALNS